MFLAHTQNWYHFIRMFAKTGILALIPLNSYTKSIFHKNPSFVNNETVVFATCLLCRSSRFVHILMFLAERKRRGFSSDHRHPTTVGRWSRREPPADTETSGESLTPVWRGIRWQLQRFKFVNNNIEFHAFLNIHRQWFRHGKGFGGLSSKGRTSTLRSDLISSFWYSLPVFQQSNRITTVFNASSCTVCPVRKNNFPGVHERSVATVFDRADNLDIVVAPECQEHKRTQDDQIKTMFHGQAISTITGRWKLKEGKRHYHHSLFPDKLKRKCPW